MDQLAVDLTYEPFYGLTEKPFSLSADPRFLWRSPAHATAFERLEAGIRRREGLIVVSGEIGMGKTTLCRAVLEHLDRRTFSTFVPDPFLTREDLLKTLLVGFGVMSPADLQQGRLDTATRQDLSYPLYEFLDSLVPLHAFAVLVIDEAQHLTLPVLEEIRILAELERRHKLLQVVLVGQPELRTSLKRPELRQVEQRVSVHCSLEPLAASAVGAYLTHRLSVAAEGPARVAFDDDAIAAIARASGGVPRLINRVADRALHMAWQARAWAVDTGAVRAALDDLGLEPDHPHSHVRQDVAVAVDTPSDASAGRPAPTAASPGTAPIDPAPRHAAPVSDAPVNPAPWDTASKGTPVALSADATPPEIAALFSPPTRDTARTRGASLPIEAPGPAGIPSVYARGLMWASRAGATALVVLGVASGLGAVDVPELVGLVAASSVPPPAPRSPYDAREQTSHGIVPPDAGAASRLDARTRAADTYAVLVGSFSVRTAADREAARLTSQGYRARLLTRASGGNTWLDVVVEGYGTFEDALAAVNALRGQSATEGARLLKLPGASLRFD